MAIAYFGGGKPASNKNRNYNVFVNCMFGYLELTLNICKLGIGLTAQVVLIMHTRVLCSEHCGKVAIVSGKRQEQE